MPISLTSHLFIFWGNEGLILKVLHPEDWKGFYRRAYTSSWVLSLLGICGLWAVGWGLRAGTQTHKSILISCKAGTTLIEFVLLRWHTLQEKRKNCFPALKLVCWFLPNESLIVKASTLIIHFYLLKEIFLCDTHMFIHFLVVTTWNK